jgi:hypothetical protein
MPATTMCPVVHDCVDPNTAEVGADHPGGFSARPGRLPPFDYLPAMQRKSTALSIGASFKDWELWTPVVGLPKPPVARCRKQLVV